MTAMVAQASAPCDATPGNFRRSHRRQHCVVLQIPTICSEAALELPLDCSNDSVSEVAPSGSCENKCEQIPCAATWKCSDWISMNGAATCTDVKPESGARLQTSNVLGGRQLGYYSAPTWNEQRPFAAEGDTVKERRRVRFSDECMVYEVTPYAEIYGMHPREFAFEKDYSLSPWQYFTGRGYDFSLAADGLQNEDEDESDSDDYEFDESDVQYVIRTTE